MVLGEFSGPNRGFELLSNMEKPTVWLCSFTKSLVLYSLSLGYAEGVQANGGNPILFVNDAYAVIERPNFEHVYLASARKRSGYLRDCVAVVLKSRQLLQMIRKSPPTSVLFVNSSPINVWILILLRVAASRCSTFVYLHEPGSYAEKVLRGLGRRWAITLLAVQLLELALCSGGIVSSERLREVAARGLFAKRERLIAAPLLLVDDGLPYTIKIPRSVLYAGRAVANRGIGEFLDAVRYSKQHSLGIKFLIATPDNIADDLRLRGLSAQDFERAHHGSPLTDAQMAEFFSRSEVVVLLYRNEVFQSGIPPMAFMHGALVLGTDMPGVLEDVQNGRTGWIISRIYDAKDILMALQAVPYDLREMQIQARSEYEKKFSPAAFSTYYKYMLD